MEKWLSVAELSKQAQVPESTARRYLTKYERFFRFDDRQRGRRYEPQSVPILVFIQNCYSQGMEAQEIEEALAKQFPMTVFTGESPQVVMQPSTLTLATKDDLEAVLSEVRAVREENQRFHQYLEQRIEDRDRKLMETLRLMTEARQEIATTIQEKKKWYQFWK